MIGVDDVTGLEPVGVAVGTSTEGVLMEGISVGISEGTGIRGVDTERLGLGVGVSDEGVSAGGV